MIPLLGVVLLAAAIRQEGCESGPPHERRVRKGEHPRLFLHADELPGLREKISKDGSISKELFDLAVSRAPREAGIPDLDTAAQAAAPAASLLLESEEGRRKMARIAVESSLAILNRWSPPYPNQPVWMEWFLYRYVILTYDCCGWAMTDEERRRFQREILALCTRCASLGVETSTNNHKVVAAVILGLAALSLEVDIADGLLTIQDEPVVHGRFTPAGDFLAHRSSFNVRKMGLRPGESRFLKERDYAVRWIREGEGGDAIVWLPHGSAPSPEETFYVSYDVAPDFARWKELARLALQRSLDHVWCDGASLAGVMYGAFTLNWAVDLFEAMRRNMGIDFSRHPCVRDVVKWLPTELLPGAEFRANNRNDSNYRDLYRAVPFLVWAAGRYAGDAEGRGATAAWLLSRAPSWKTLTSWREALWVPEPFPDAPKAAIPLSRFFRGHNLANFRTGDWNGPPEGWSLFSLSAGPFTMSEHDQTDKGSFTFYALGEDFAVDSGYAQGDGRSDSTAAHNYVLVDGQGQIGPWGSSANVRSYFLTPGCDGVHADLKSTYVNYSSWLTQDPLKWPMRSAERTGLLMKFSDRAPYAVVADTIRKDDRPHAYEWLLHTGTGNTIRIEGGNVFVLGKNTGTTLRVYLHGDSPIEFRQDTWTPKEAPVHPRLIAAVKSESPHLLAILVPERKDEPAPLRVESEDGKERVAAIVSRGTSRDWIVLSRNPGAKVCWRDVETDAALAVLRLDEKKIVKGWFVEEGSFLKIGGRILWSVIRPRGVTGSACWSEGALAVTAPTIEEFEAHAPGVREFTVGDRTLPGVSNGESLRWKGRRTLLDTLPPKTPAMCEDFSNAVAPYWFVLPLADTGFSRVIDGEFCCPGVRREWISYTHRNFNRNPWQVGGPPRADVFQWPRCRFLDSVLHGEFTVVDFAPGRTFAIAGRVSDRRYPEEGVDQDCIQVELNPTTREATLVQHVGGVRTSLTSAKGVELLRGKKYAYEFSLRGNAVIFSLNGTQKIKFVDKAGKLPASGYFQWEVSEGLHLHLDDVRVDLEPSR